MNEKDKFYSLMDDTTFKYLYKKERTRGFFNGIIKYYTGINLNGFSLMDIELNSGNSISSYRLDLLLINREKDTIVNIELNESNRKYHEKRNRKYIERIAGNSYDIKKDIIVYQVNINNYLCSYDKKRIIDNYMLRNEDNTNEIEDLRICNIFVPKVEKNCYNEVDEKLKLFLAKSYEEMRELAKDDEEMNIIVDEIEKLNRDKYFGALYDAREEQENYEKYLELHGKEEGFAKGKEEGFAKGVEEGKKKGIEEGKKEGKKEGKREATIETAKAMLSKNLDIDLISEITNLSKEEIQKLN